MSMVQNLKAVLDKQKDVLASLEKEIASIEATDLVSENQKLKTELTKYHESVNSLKSGNTRLTEENKRLRTALYEQFYNEKMQVLNAAEKRMDVYYRANYEGEINRLSKLEMFIKTKINEMEKVLRENRISIEDEIFVRLEELRNQLNVKVAKAREEIMKQTKAYSEIKAAELSKLRQEQITEAEIRARTKQNNIESLIGLNVINKLGILLLVIGVITAAQFTYFKLPDTLKGLFTFAVGILLLVAGELLNRKKPNVFSLGITSGGVAILYVGLVLSYFQFNILGMYQALGLCVLITAGAFVLSQRYNSQTISAFAMIGGYLPIFSIAGSKTMVYGAMVYFIVLNLLALIISVNKKWTVTAYIGFVLNVIGTVYIGNILISGTPFRPQFTSDGLISVFYILFAFINYTLIPITGTYRKKIGFKNSDIVLLTLNTLISSFLLYMALYSVDLKDFAGFLSLVLSIVYLSLGWFIEKKMRKEKKVAVLFYITGLTSVILIIPFQFGKVWLTLGWLVEGIAILSYGIYKELKGFKKAGTVISLLCLWSFLFFDIINYHDSLFTFKYLAITAGSFIVLGTMIYKKHLFNIPSQVFKYCTFINLWLFSLYLIVRELKPLISEMMQKSHYNSDFLIFAAMILVSFVIAYVIPRIKILCDDVMKGISVSIYTLSFLSVFALNFVSPVKGYLTQVPMAVKVVGTIELAVIAVLAILAMRDLLLHFMIGRELGIEWYPLVLSFYFILILTQNLIIQYSLEFNNAVISIIYIATALAWITFGFIKRYVLIRRFGLALSMLSVAKLFIIDLAFLTQGYRIVSYFVFGLILIAISFVYQYFSKRIENISEVMPDDKKDIH
jgi:uncharacterized membrane protein